MNSVLDLFLGDPVYDDQQRVIRRDFGVKNIVAIMVVGFIGYSLMGEMKPKSGKVMKGGDMSGPTIFLFVIIVYVVASYFLGELLWLKVLKVPKTPGYQVYASFVGGVSIVAIWAVGTFFKGEIDEATRGRRKA